MLGKQGRKRSMLNLVLAKSGIADFEKFFLGFRNWLLTVSPLYYLIVSFVVIAIQMRVWRNFN